MKKLICLLLALCMVLALAACGETKPEKNTDTGSEIASVSEKETESDKGGTAGSNIPLKDNAEKARELIKLALCQLLEKAYGEKMADIRITDTKIFTAEEEQEIESLKEKNLSFDEIAFNVSYEILPGEGADINELTVANGRYDESTGWVIDKHGVGILRPDASEECGYKITDFGTGF